MLQHRRDAPGSPEEDLDGSRGSGSLGVTHRSGTLRTMTLNVMAACLDGGMSVVSIPKNFNFFSILKICKGLKTCLVFRVSFASSGFLLETRLQ